MKTTGALRHQTIESLTSQHAPQGIEAQIALWNQIAVQIVLIVGEDGFESLFARSVFLSRAQFPWLAKDTKIAPSDHRFRQLRSHLEAQSAAMAADASRVLLITLTDILASLIGESLTASILKSAWGTAVPNSVEKDEFL